MHTSQQNITIFLNIRFGSLMIYINEFGSWNFNAIILIWSLDFVDRFLLHRFDSEEILVLPSFAKHAQRPNLFRSPHHYKKLKATTANWPTFAMTWTYSIEIATHACHDHLVSVCAFPFAKLITHTFFFFEDKKLCSQVCSWAHTWPI